MSDKMQSSLLPKADGCDFEDAPLGNQKWPLRAQSRSPKADNQGEDGGGGT